MSNAALHNLKSECEKAAHLLKSFLDGGIGNKHRLYIPSDVLARAQGLAMFTVSNSLFYGTHGNGLVVAKLNDGSWSAPSAIQAGQDGKGLQVSFAVSIQIFLVFNTKHAVEMFCHGSRFPIGENGYSWPGPMVISPFMSSPFETIMSPLYIYYKSDVSLFKTWFVDFWIEEWPSMNKVFYGKGIHASELLNGVLPMPVDAASLKDILRMVAPRYSTIGVVDENSSSVRKERASTFTANDTTQDAPEEQLKPKKKKSQSQ